ncbi:hypothetical protein ACEPPN_005434 [Leptodophora sp. 'Broadleaf-Isolate-01']
MASRAIDNYVRDIFEDLGLRLDADSEHGIGLGTYHTHPARVSEIIDEINGRMVNNADKAVHMLAPVLGYRETLSVITRVEPRMLRDISWLARQLSEVSMLGFARYPYVPKEGYNPYRPIKPTRSYNYAKSDAKKKAAPGQKSVPVPVPGEGPGPKPDPAKTKKKGESDANWEDLAMHSAYKEQLDIKKQSEIKESTAKKGPKVAVKKGRA